MKTRTPSHAPLTHSIQKKRAEPNSVRAITGPPGAAWSAIR